MTNEIKVGDTVRVSKDAPICIIGSASEIECAAVVLGTNADIAVIGFRTREKQRYDAYKVPTKYLVKAGGEEKKPLFHFGDIVCYGEIGEPMRSGRVVSERNHNNLYAVCSGIDLLFIEEEALNPYDPIKDGYISPIENEPRVTDNTDWDAYTADLAKEIAIVYAKQKRKVRLAVRAAKAVVEELKKK